MFRLPPANRKHVQPRHLNSQHHCYTVFLLLGGLALPAVGCNAKFVPVEGTVLVDGKPAMEGVQVFFSPTGNTRPAEGTVTGPDGRFSMRTLNHDGVMPGDYRVCLTNSTESIPKPTSDPDFVPVNGDPPRDWFAHLAAVTKFLENPPTGPGWIPKDYAEHAKSPLRYSVVQGDNTPIFEVDSAPPKDSRKSR